MSDVAGKLAVARKAVAEIREIENTLLSVGVNQEQMNLAMKDVSTLADMAASASDDAVGVLGRMRVEVQRFLSEAEREVSEVGGEEAEVEDASG